jgi:hypothetical protein
MPGTGSSTLRRSYGGAGAGLWVKSRWGGRTSLDKDMVGREDGSWRRYGGAGVGLLAKTWWGGNRALDEDMVGREQGSW